MSDYKKIVEAALKKARLGKGNEDGNRVLNEGIVYPEGIKERMHPQLEDELANNKHSLGAHPIFPEGDESSFEEKIMGERFSEVAKRFKRAYDVSSINTKDVVSGMMPLVNDTMELESKHIKELEKLAVEMIREEFDMDEDTVEIHAELVNEITMVGPSKNTKPMAVEMEFKNYDEMVNSKNEVYKRRFINAMIQGAAKKCNHMFHMVEDELSDLDPRLANKYTKLMASADYMFYIIPKMENGVNGGVVKVQFPSTSNPKPVIYAQAMVFPVLIHELVKGVMELMSAHGLPKNKKIGEYVISKADFLAAEPWDMRLGPGLWSRFTDLIDPNDFHLKHHIYTDLVSLPVTEFNLKMREIMGGTKEGRKIIKNIVADVKAGLEEDNFNEAMDVNNEEEEIVDDQTGFDFDELLGGDDDSDDGWNIDELL